MMSEDTILQEPNTVTAQDGEFAPDHYSKELSKKDIRHNMIVLILLDAIFFTGFADLYIAMQPLLVHLKASNFMIGLVSSAPFAGLVGVIASPWISRRFRTKKYYLFFANVPYLAPLAVIGVFLLLSGKLELSSHALLMLVLWMTVAHWFFGGFCSLPHQEYVAACIPTQYRGRYTGYSFSIGGAAAIASASVGKIILDRVPEPMSYGYLFLMTWAICQTGYLAAFFGRERPTPVERSPRAWSRDMLSAFWLDKPFVRLLALHTLIGTFINPVFGFVNIYGFKTLHMIPSTAAIMQLVTQFVRIGVSAPSGWITDKFGGKCVYPWLPLIACAVLASPLVISSALGVYISVGISTIYVAVMTSTFTALAYGMPKPENRAGSYTIQLITNYVAMGTGPLIAGLLCDLFPFKTIFIGFAVISLLMYPFAKWMLSILSDDPKAYS